MRTPPAYMLPILHGIETTILGIYGEYSRLADADVIWVCEKLYDYYKKISQGKEMEDPETPSQMKQDLIDELLNILELREKEGFDDQIINSPDYRQGEAMYSSHAMLYAAGIKSIRDSARRWRKKDGRTGYLKFIKDHVI